MAFDSRMQDTDERRSAESSLNYLPLGDLIGGSDSEDFDDGIDEDFDEEAWSHFTENLAPKDKDKSIARDTEMVQYEYQPESHIMGPPPPPARRLSAPSPEPSSNSAQTSGSENLAKTDAMRLSVEASRDGFDESFDGRKDSEGGIERPMGIKAALLGDISSSPAAFEQRDRSQIPHPSNKCNLDNLNYVDLARPSPDLLGERLEAIRARNAEEHFHYRIPPGNAPPHMQMMVLLYQWAAWALEIRESKQREEMIGWVNGRFLDFMLSGGHVPGYNLKELLEIAGVDPKELYGYRGESSQQRSSMASMSSSQLAATISGKQVKTEVDVAADDGGEVDIDRSNIAVDDAQEGPFSKAKHHRVIEVDNGNDEEGVDELDDGLQESTSTDGDAIFGDHDRPNPTENTPLVDEGVSTTNLGLKRGASSDVEDDDQDAKRQRLGVETTTVDQVMKSPTDDPPQSISLVLPQSPSDSFREKYRQTFFKAQLNAVLGDHRKSQYRKDLSDWGSIDKRLRQANVSVKIINILRRDYLGGWKTWDGSDFSKLPDSLQTTSPALTIKLNSASGTATPKPSRVAQARPKQGASPKPRATLSKAQPKRKDFPKPRPKLSKAKPKSKAKPADEDYDSGDNEYTASKTSVKTRRQWAKSIAPPSKRGGEK